MANAATSSNTVTSTVQLTDKGTATPCIDDALIQELIERLQGVVEFENPSGIVVGISPPSDLSKIWFQQNSTGQITNIKYYNSLTGKWTDVTSTAPGAFEESICEDNNALFRESDGCLKVRADLILANSKSSDNLIDLDEEGALYLKESVLKGTAAQLDTTNDCNVLQKHPDSAALSVNRGASFFQQVGIAGAIIQGHVVVENDPDPTIRTLDLSTIPSINWNEDCPPTHILVTGVIAIGLGSGYSSGSWSAPAVQISAGVDQTRIVVALDADSTEGSDMNTAMVRLDPSNPKIFSYVVSDTGGVNWANVKNHLGLYIQGLLWSK